MCLIIFILNCLIKKAFLNVINKRCKAIKYLYIFRRGHTHATLNHIIEMSTYLLRIPTIVSDRKSGQRGSPGLRQQTSLSSVHHSCQLVPFQLHSNLLHLLAQVRRQRTSARNPRCIFDHPTLSSAYAVLFTVI